MAFLVNRLTILLGKLSYSMYLIHGFFVFTLMPILGPRYPWLVHHKHEVRWSLVASFTIAVLSAGLAMLTYHFIEEPGIVLGRRVVRWVQGRPQGRTSMPPLTATVDTPDAQF